MRIKQFTGYSALGTMRIGSNGDSTGSPEIIVGTPTANVSGRKSWDPYLPDGFNSGWVNFAFTVLAAGGANGIQLSVDGAVPGAVTYSSAPSVQLGAIVLQAVVTDSNRRVSFKNVIVKYFRTSQTAYETVTLDDVDAPVASTIGANIPEADTEVDALRSDFQRVTVTGSVCFEDSATELPGEADLVASIFLYAYGVKII